MLAPQVPHCRSIGLTITIWQLPRVKVTAPMVTISLTAFTLTYLYVVGIARGTPSPV